MQYLFRLDNGKRFLALFLFALPACLMLAAFFPVTGYFEWLLTYTGAYASYSELWMSLIQRDTLRLGFLFMGYILLVFSVSAITTITIRSMRVGKFQVKSLFYLINENFFPSLALVTAVTVSLLFFQSLICLFLFLWQFIPNQAASYILSMVFSLGIVVLMFYIFSILILWLPVMSINGLKPFKAMETAASKSHSDKGRIFTAYIIPLGVILVLGILSYLLRAIGILKFIINAVSYTLLTVYFTSVSLLAYFEIEGITREDLVKRPYLRR
ncbi:MAG: hypothetical protein PHC84_03690 [Clostridia bacterium]|nr:hypothetical protein [Clostridia bacterium]